MIGPIVYGMTWILDICSFVLIVLAIKVMKTSSRYLYRYIAFCFAEFCTDILILMWQFVNGEDKEIFAICMDLVYLFMATWRILEVTVLNNYFNSLKNQKSFNVDDRALSYIPPNQALFQANVITTVQALLSSLTMMFDEIEHDNPNTNLYRI